MKQFTDEIEGNMKFQQDLWIAYTRAKEQFDILKETYVYALILEEFFFKRFIDTCNIEVSQLAYVLTPEGLYDF